MRMQNWTKYHKNAFFSDFRNEVNRKLREKYLKKKQKQIDGQVDENTNQVDFKVKKM